jgi:sortase A
MKRFIMVIATVLAVVQLTPYTAFGAQDNGYGRGQGRPDTVNVNDYSTDSWDRFDNNYQFNTGPDYNEELGKPTTTDADTRNKDTENVRRNKDAAAIPPTYGLFSGEFDTDYSNPYVTPDNYEYATEIPNANRLGNYDTMEQGINGADQNGTLPSTSLLSPESNTVNASSSQSVNNNGAQVTISTNSSYRPYSPETEAIEYENGSIGRIEIPGIDLKVRVYEGESLDSMQKGVGHFSFTSAWDGNVGIAGHNGGSAGYFEDLKDLERGDKVIYTTYYGTRTYRVTSIKTISDTDYSLLEYTSGDRLTLITCVRGESDRRLAVIAELDE